ncbi:regulator of G-protein signaling 20 isoform X3 [Frankliniella occidentalis]|uniref:Regulator of G-protein signaling 20 isoform X3 n=1 Tax=Frankliniella occidentalis TaxID=133901 RepID=A0A9C6U2G6_FRAOC|nr:regulator of G-protein signaling 20 isoform X3 [Frankliniella occidentalis]
MSGGSKDKMGPGPECRLRGGATSSAMPKVGPSDRDKGVLDHEEIKESSEKDKENDGEEEKEQADEKQDTEKKKEKKAKEKRCDKQKTKRNKERNSRFRQRHNNEDGDENPPLRKPCCFCWCCCCSCSWFANFLSNCASCLCFSLTSKSGDDDHRNGDPDPMDMLTCDGEPPPPLEEIRAWGKSFDKLMKSTAGRRVFRDFLRCEYSEENILFWLACEELKKESNPDLIEEKARFIYEDYISILSPKEVSLDSRVRELVNRNMVDPTPRTFDEAQLQIYTLMHRDSYPRFVNSSLFRQIAQLDSSNGNGSQSGSQAGTPSVGGGGAGGGSLRRQSNA